MIFVVQSSKFLTDDNIIVNYNNLFTVKLGRHCLNECSRSSGPCNVLSNPINSWWSMSVCVRSMSEIRVCCKGNPLLKKELKVEPFGDLYSQKQHFLLSLSSYIGNWTCNFQYQSLLNDPLWPKWQDLVIYVLFFSQGWSKMKNLF